MASETGLQDGGEESTPERAEVARPLRGIDHRWNAEREMIVAQPIGALPVPSEQTDKSVDWRSQAVLPVWPDTGQLLGLSRQSTYDAVARGEIPSLKIGRRLIVPVVKLRKMLGELPDTAA